MMLRKICAGPDNANQISASRLTSVLLVWDGVAHEVVLPVLCLVMSCSSSPAQEKTNRNTKPKTAEASTDARENQSATTAKLPVRRVVLYKNGVGYFEHLGRVRGSQEST